MSDPARTSSPEGPVHRAFGLLQLVVAAGEPVGVRELGRRAGLSRSTTARMLGILDQLGMVERTPDGAAFAGAALATLTTKVLGSPAVLGQRLRPMTGEMQREYGENAAVGVDDGTGFAYLVSARVPAAVQVADPVGETFPYHLVAPGLVAMAAWSPDRLDAYLADPLDGSTDRSVTEPRRIRARLDAIRRDGYAWTDQELDLEVNGLAAPIRDHAGATVAIATLYGPSYRFAESLRPDLGPDFAAFVTARAEAALTG
jgi:IclR family acetate operon transcriptional repressor